MDILLVAEDQNRTEAAVADMKISEVAEKLGVSARTVLRWAKMRDEKDAPFPNAYQSNPVLETSPWYIPQKDFDSFLARRKGHRRNGNG